MKKLQCASLLLVSIQINSMEMTLVGPTQSPLQKNIGNLIESRDPKGLSKILSSSDHTALKELFDNSYQTLTEQADQSINAAQEKCQKRQLKYLTEALAWVGGASWLLYNTAHFANYSEDGYIAGAPINTIAHVSSYISASAFTLCCAWASRELARYISKSPAYENYYQACTVKHLLNEKNKALNIAAQGQMPTNPDATQLV